MRSILMYYAATALGVALLASEAPAQNIKPGNEPPKPKAEPPRPRPNPPIINADRARLNNERAIIVRDRAILNVERTQLNAAVLWCAQAFNPVYPATPYLYPSWTPNPWMTNPWMTNPWMPYGNMYSPFGMMGGFNSINYWGMPFGGGMGGAGMGGTAGTGFGTGFGSY